MGDEELVPKQNSLKGIIQIFKGFNLPREYASSDFPPMSLS